MSDPNVNTAAEIYAQIRDKALEDAAKVCIISSNEPSSLWEEQGCWSHAAEHCAALIRALKRQP